MSPSPNLPLSGLRGLNPDRTGSTALNNGDHDPNSGSATISALPSSSISIDEPSAIERLSGLLEDRSSDLSYVKARRHVAARLEQQGPQLMRLLDRVHTCLFFEEDPQVVDSLCRALRNCPDALEACLPGIAFSLLNSKNDRLYAVLKNITEQPELAIPLAAPLYRAYMTNTDSISGKAIENLFTRSNQDRLLGKLDPFENTFVHSESGVKSRIVTQLCCDAAGSETSQEIFSKLMLCFYLTTNESDKVHALKAMLDNRLTLGTHRLAAFVGSALAPQHCSAVAARVRLFDCIALSHDSFGLPPGSLEQIVELEHDIWVMFHAAIAQTKLTGHVSNGLWKIADEVALRGDSNDFQVVSDGLLKILRNNPGRDLAAEIESYFCRNAVSGKVSNEARWMSIRAAGFFQSAPTMACNMLIKIMSRPSEGRENVIAALNSAGMLLARCSAAEIAKTYAFKSLKDTIFDLTYSDDKGIATFANIALQSARQDR